MKKGMGWPIGVAVILFATVAGNLGVIYFTRDDPSFAVEPDYYRKAVEWDSTQATQARSDALAWTVAAHADRATDGLTHLVLSLTDSSGTAVPHAQLSGTLLHLARANDVQSVRFTEIGSGDYEATVPMTRAGLWELRLVGERTAAQGPEHFVHTLRIDTDAASTGAATVPATLVPPSAALPGS